MEAQQNKYQAYAQVCYVSSLLMHARSAEGGGVAVGLLQVGQSLFVQLHGISGKPALYLATSQLKPAAHTDYGLAARINTQIVFFHSF